MKGRGLGFEKRWWLSAHILLELFKGSTHGYELLDMLSRKGITWPGKGSIGTVYKQLRDMEAGGLVQSMWDTEGKGAPKRIYTITSYGIKYLENITTSLKLHINFISNFIDEFEKNKERRR